MTTEFLTKEVQRLIAEGKRVVGTEFDAGMQGVVYWEGRPTGVELHQYSCWQAGCKNLIRLLGDYGDPWKETFDDELNSGPNATRMLGTLEAIEHAISGGLLIRMEDMVRAESFHDLLDQADYLHSQGYYLAAGVIGRAVLEGHLRAWATTLSLPIAKPKPTLNDFKDALYQAKKFTLSVSKHIDAMAATGNDAAHNKPELTKDAVARMLRDVREFMAKHS